MTAEPINDTLYSVQSQYSKYRGSLSAASDIRRVITDKNELSVAVQGDMTKPAILTYHDLGLNCTYHSHQKSINYVEILEIHNPYIHPPTIPMFLLLFFLSR